MTNPTRPQPDDPTEVEWSWAVADTVVRRYATTAARDADLTGHTLADLAGQVVVIVDPSGVPRVQVHNGTAWVTVAGGGFVQWQNPATAVVLASPAAIPGLSLTWIPREAVYTCRVDATLWNFNADSTLTLSSSPSTPGARAQGVVACAAQVVIRGTPFWILDTSARIGTSVTTTVALSGSGAGLGYGGNYGPAMLTIAPPYALNPGAVGG